MPRSLVIARPAAGASQARNRFVRSGLIRLSLFVAAMLPAPSASAATRFWNVNPPTAGSWSTPGNWLPQPGAVPTANDLAIIGNGGTAELTQAGQAVGVSLGDFGTGTLRVLSGGQLSVTAGLTVGSDRNGTLEIRDGGTVSDANAVIADRAGSNSTATVDGFGSQWTTSGRLTVGRSGGDGTLTVRNGNVSASDIYVGQDTGSKGKITLDAGSTLTTAGQTLVGFFGGNGTLEIKDGSRMEPSINPHSAFASIIGSQAGSSGTVTVETNGRWINKSQLLAYRGSLNIKTGGGVRANEVRIGTASGVNGNVTVEGAGSFLESSTSINNVLTGTVIQVGATIGGADVGVLTVKDQGLVTGNLLDVGRKGTVYVTTARVVLTNDPLDVIGITEDGVYVGGATSLGRLQIRDGGNVDGNTVLARVNGPQNTLATVDGDGSTWGTGALTVGHDAFGELQLSREASVSAATVSLGVAEGSTGVVKVDNYSGVTAGLSAQSIIVGGSGTGRLDITRGGNVGSITAFVGSLPSLTGEGRVTVDGSGSQWAVLSRFVVGDSGHGTLNITRGAEVIVGPPTGTPAHLDIGRNPQGLSPFTRGTVTVDGNGSFLDVSGNLTVGLRGTGELQIKNGGEVRSKFGFIGIEAGSSGSVVVDDGTWLTENLVVGFEGSALLDVRENGIVALGGQGLLGPNGRLEGNGLLTTTTEILLNGVLAPGLFVQAGAGSGSDEHSAGTNSLPGRLRIQGNYSQSNTGKLEIDLASPTNYDVLQVSGAAALNGTLEIKLLDGFVPSPSQTFNFLAAGSQSGQFQNVVVTSSNGSGGTFTLTPTPTGLALSNFQATPGAGGLVAHWNAENGATDVTGNGHDGIFRGNAETTTDGPFGKAFTLDGNGDYIEIGDELDMGTSDFTLSAWIKGDPSMHQWARIFDKGFASAYSLHRRASLNEVGFEMLNSGNFFGTDSLLIDNTWHHIALVKDGTTVTIYADGEAENTNTVSGAAQDNSLPLLIGFNPGEGTPGFWKGLLDELRIYDRALGASEIAELASIPDDSLPGDFNDDGKVDAADYVVWRKNGMSQPEFNIWRANFGRTSASETLPGDFNFDGTVNAADYVVWRKNGMSQAEFNTWRANFGNSVGSGSAGASPSQEGVPEPSAMVLAIFSLLAAGGCLTQRRRGAK